MFDDNVHKQISILNQSFKYDLTNYSIQSYLLFRDENNQNYTLNIQYLEGYYIQYSEDKIYLNKISPDHYILNNNKYIFKNIKNAIDGLIEYLEK